MYSRPSAEADKQYQYMKGVDAEGNVVDETGGIIGQKTTKLLNKYREGDK